VKRALILDYGVGNLGSISNFLGNFYPKVEVGNSKKVIENANLVILPGVGSFGQCSKLFKENTVKEALLLRHETNAPILGICIGFQLLSQGSEESKGSKGLGIFSGSVKRVNEGTVIGWKQVKLTRDISKRNDYFFFNHSFGYVDADSTERLFLDDEEKYYAIAIKNGTVGLQFHPEKSQQSGFDFFVDLIENVWV
jgi:glutamine amidotransferase